MEIKNKLINNANMTLTTTNNVVSDAVYFPARRVVLTITNTSTGGEKVSISIGSQAEAGKGIVLSQGAVCSFSQDGAYIPPQNEVNAIGSAATATIAIYEETEIETI